MHGSNELEVDEERNNDVSMFDWLVSRKIWLTEEQTTWWSRVKLRVLPSTTDAAGFWNKSQ